MNIEAVDGAVAGGPAGVAARNECLPRVLITVVTISDFSMPVLQHNIPCMSHNSTTIQNLTSMGMGMSAASVIGDHRRHFLQDEQNNRKRFVRTRAAH